MTFQSRTISQTLFQFVARFFSTAANFFLILLVARGFGSEGLGTYNKVFSFIAFFALFIDFGLNSVFIKLPDYRKRFVSLIVLRLILSGILIIILQPILFLLPYDLHAGTGFSPVEKIYIEIIAFSLILYSFIHSFMAIVQKERMYERTILPQIIFAFVVILFGIVGYRFKDLAVFFIGSMSGLMFQIIALLVSLKFLFGSSGNTYALNLQKIKSFVGDLFKRSLPIGATLFLNSLYVRIDVFILAMLRPTVDVGVYTLAYKFFEFPLIFSFFVMNALYPQMVTAYEKGVKELQTFIRFRFWKIIGFACMVTLFAYIFGPLIAIIKDDFSGSVKAFRILSLSYPIFFASNVLLWIVITTNRERILPFVYGLSLIANVLLNLIFIPLYGYTASAWTTVLTECLVLAIFRYYTVKIFN